MDVRIPPHNEDAEKAVLGALLTDGSSSGEAVDLVTSIVDRDDFSVSYTHLTLPTILLV